MFRQYEIYSFDQLSIMFDNDNALLTYGFFFSWVGNTEDMLSSYYMYLGGMC